jgi:hypothetical protein
MFAKDLSNKIFSPPRHQGTKFNINRNFFLVPLWLFFPVYPGWVEVNGGWEWPPATITRKIAVENRSHNLKLHNGSMKFFFRFDWMLAAGGDARMKLQIVGTGNRRISNKKFRMMKYGIAALSLFSKIIMIEYLTSIFIIPCSLFDIRFSIVSFSI